MNVGLIDFLEDQGYILYADEESFKSAYPK